MNKKILTIVLVGLFLATAIFGTAKIVSAQQGAQTQQIPAQVLPEPITYHIQMNNGYGLGGVRIPAMVIASGPETKSACAYKMGPVRTALTLKDVLAKVHRRMALDCSLVKEARQAGHLVKAQVHVSMVTVT